MAGRKSAPENETEREKFVRLFNARMGIVSEGFRLVGNLATGNYERKSADADALEKTLNVMVTDTVKLFREGKTEKAAQTFLAE